MRVRVLSPTLVTHSQRASAVIAYGLCGTLSGGPVRFTVAGSTTATRWSVLSVTYSRPPATTVRSGRWPMDVVTGLLRSAGLTRAILSAVASVAHSQPPP